MTVHAIAADEQKYYAWHAPQFGPLTPGSEDHKAAFCHVLLDTHNPYKPAIMNWPQLSDAERDRLTSLPIWDIAVRTEERAMMRVRRYAETITDPLLREAVELNAFEEGRHRQVLSHLAQAYGIAVGPIPPPNPPRDKEWAFMITGYSECIDSFFAFGLFETARRSGYFPPELVAAFEPVMQEECRHILFFANWVAWRRRSLPLWRRPLFWVKCLAAYGVLIRERLETARDVGGGDNFTVKGHEAMGIDLDFRGLVAVCLAENDRRFAGYDPRLVRPKLMPFFARLALRFLPQNSK